MSQAENKKWLDELSRLERQADQARKTFWCGHYEEAEQQFATLANSVHPSIILYQNECAMCKLAQGDYKGTEERLRQVDSLLNTYYSEEREKRALSAFGAEAEKIYRGDPYEQAADSDNENRIDKNETNDFAKQCFLHHNLLNKPPSIKK